MGAPVNSRLPQIGEEYDAGKMRALIRALEIEFALRPANGPLIIGGGRTITKYFSASVTWDPPSVANGAQTTTTVTVTGVKIAEQNAAIVGFTKSLQGMQLTAYVSADDTVTCVLQNNTGGAIDLASGTLTVAAFKHG